MSTTDEPIPILTASGARECYSADNVSKECKPWLRLVTQRITDKSSTEPRGTRYLFPSFSQAQWNTGPNCLLELKRHLRGAGHTVSEGYYHDHCSPSDSHRSLYISWAPTFWDSYYSVKDRLLGSIRYE